MTKMRKMALSAMIKQVMPTTPLEGFHEASDSRASAVITAFMKYFSGSFVFPIRVSRMFQVPKRPATFDSRNFSEVIFRRRRTGRPLKSPGVPGIISGRLPFAQGQDDVGYEAQHAGDLERDADGADQIQQTPAASVFIRVDSTRHAKDAWNVHGVERDMEPDEKEPEMPFAQALAEEAASRLGKPVIYSRED